MSGLLIIVCAIVVFMLGLIAGVNIERLGKEYLPKINKKRALELATEKIQAETEHCEHREGGLRCNACEYESACDRADQVPTGWTGALGRL